MSQMLMHTSSKQRTCCRSLFLEKFAALLPQGASVLDLGCAFGRDSAWLAEKGFQVSGIDYSSSFIERAQKLVPSATFIIGDVRHLHFPVQSLDGIWAHMSLLHLKKADLPHALESIRTILRDGGILGLGMKSGEGEGFMNDDRYHGEEKYFAYYKEDEANKYLVAAGFDILETSVQKSERHYQDHDNIQILAKKK